MPSQTNNKTIAKRCPRLLLTIVALFWSCVAGATLFKPTVTNYTSRQFEASNQNWACGQDRDGIMYFGNNDGLLVFDGSRWMCYPVPGHYIVRSVFVDGNRIYTGSYQQFGYFSRDDYGEMRYTSISDSMDAADFNDDEIWKIERTGDYIIFQSFRSLFVYDGTRVKTYVNIRPLFIYNVSGKIYAQLIDGDFARFDPEAGRLTTVIERKRVGDDDIVGACDYEPGLILLATESNGLYIYDAANDNIRAFATEYDDGIKHSQVNRMLVTPKRDIIIGTIQGGIYAMNQSGKPLWHYCLENGLNNNSVLGLLYDNFGNIWSALDYGISLIHTSLPFLILEPEHTDPYIGMTYSVARFGDLIYMATNQGLYTYSFETGKISEVPRVKAQTWHVSKIDNQLFVGCNTTVDVLSTSGTEHYQQQCDRHSQGTPSQPRCASRIELLPALCLHPGRRRSVAPRPPAKGFRRSGASDRDRLRRLGMVRASRLRCHASRSLRRPFARQRQKAFQVDEQQQQQHGFRDEDPRSRRRI